MGLASLSGLHAVPGWPWGRCAAGVRFLLPCAHSVLRHLSFAAGRLSPPDFLSGKPWPGPERGAVSSATTQSSVLC